MASRDVLERELAHHEEIYSGFAQEHFARPAVRAFRRHSVTRMLQATGVSQASRLLSLGCGIGDTELLLAPRVAHIVGVDLSPSAVQQARRDADASGLTNVEFHEGDLDGLRFPPESFDAVVSIFFMHHLGDDDLAKLPACVAALLRPGGVYYGLDPSRYRLSGAIGKLLIPHLMEKHQSPDERELAPGATGALFRRAGFETRVRTYDFLSTPCAGLFPGSARLYRAARLIDDLVVRIPLLRAAGSNFEVIARRPL